MLIYMITTLLDSFYDKDIVNRIKYLIEDHIKLGIKSYYFYIAGDVLLYSLNEVLLDYFIDNYYCAWSRIFSSLLRIIIPIVKNNEEENTVKEILNMFSYHYDKDKYITKKEENNKEDEKRNKEECVRIAPLPNKKIEEDEVKDSEDSLMSNEFNVDRLSLIRTYVYQTNKKNHKKYSSKKRSNSSSKLICSPRDIFSPNTSFIEPTII